MQGSLPSSIAGSCDSHAAPAAVAFRLPAPPAQDACNAWMSVASDLFDSRSVPGSTLDLNDISGSLPPSWKSITTLQELWVSTCFCHGACWHGREGGFPLMSAFPDSQAPEQQRSDRQPAQGLERVAFVSHVSETHRPCSVASPAGRAGCVTAEALTSSA